MIPTVQLAVLLETIEYYLKIYFANSIWDFVSVSGHMNMLYIARLFKSRSLKCLQTNATVKINNIYNIYAGSY